MEEKDFGWVLRHLNHARCKLPILDTTFFFDNIMQARFSTGANNSIQKMNSYQSTYKTLLDCVKEMQDQHQKNSELKSIGHVIGYYIIHNKRKVIDTCNSSEVLKELQQHVKVPYIQTALGHPYGLLKEYVLDLWYNHNGYSSSLKEAGETVRNHVVFDCARDMANVIINWLEQSCKKRIIHLELDLFEDNERTLWLGRVMNCWIINENDLEKYNILNTEDLSKIPRKSKSSLIRLSGQKKENKESLKKPVVSLRILSPETSLDSSNKEKDSPDDRINRKISRKDVISHHFIELISKTNVKNMGKPTSNEEIDHETGRIIDLITNNSDDKRNERFKFTKMLKDILIETIPDRAKDNRSQATVFSRSFRTPEQAFHYHAHRPKVNATTKKTRLPKKKKEDLFKRRKNQLMQKNMKNAKLEPLFSDRYSELYSTCFKPIRLVKSQRKL